MFKEKPKKEDIINVIKYEGGNETFVWKHPTEDFALGSQLIVHESQEAIFFRDGKALDLFGAGRYTLETGKLPVMNKIYNLSANENVFHSEVYFINMTTQMNIKWGTDSKVRLFDPASGLHIEIGASGSFNLKVVNSRKLLLKLVGTVSSFTQNEIVGDGYSNKQAAGKFKSLVVANVKTGIANIIKENNINILEVDGYLEVISQSLMDKINQTLEDYGLFMPEFYVTNIATPDDDPNFKKLKSQFAERTLKIRQEEILKAEAEAAYGRKILQAQTDADLLKVKALAEAEAYKIQAYAEAEEMRVKGYTYQQETARQVGLEAMKNGISGGGGSAVGDVAGLGIALGTMGGVMGMTKEAMNPVMSDSLNMGKNAVSSQPTWDCQCGNKGITGKFCSQCGAKQPNIETWDCQCGNKGITGKFCSECGAKRPDVET